MSCARQSRVVGCAYRGGMYAPDNSGSKALGVAAFCGMTVGPCFGLLAFVPLAEGANAPGPGLLVAFAVWLIVTVVPAAILRRMWRRQFLAQFPRYTDGQGEQSWL